MNTLSDIITGLQNRLFRSVVTNRLVYNTCWEDPRIDRELMRFGSESRLAMLTSAGCNALDYLLDGTAHLDCVDINPAQNALLELKKALFRNGNYELLWDFFGEGSKKGAEYVYRKQLREYLPDEAARYWDKKIGYFSPDLSSPGIYFRGTSGMVARLVNRRIRRKELYPQVLNMLNAQSLEEQAYYFREIEPQLWGPFSKWLVRQAPSLTLLGVPASQRRMIRERYRDGVLDFIRQSLRKVFTELPLNDNYFWRVYLTGSYSRNCCPNYLREENFSLIRNRIDAIDTHTTNLSDFLERQSETYTHFVLLDHQDWMANVRPDLLAEEWNRILAKSRSGTKILFRSAGASIDFLPGFVFDKVDFQAAKTEALHPRDRVGTYESTHLGIVQ